MPLRLTRQHVEVIPLLYRGVPASEGKGGRGGKAHITSRTRKNKHAQPTPKPSQRLCSHPRLFHSLCQADNTHTLSLSISSLARSLSLLPHPSLYRSISLSLILSLTPPPTHTHTQTHHISIHSPLVTGGLLSVGLNHDVCRVVPLYHIGLSVVMSTCSAQPGSRGSPAPSEPGGGEGWGGAHSQKTRTRTKAPSHNQFHDPNDSQHSTTGTKCPPRHTTHTQQSEWAEGKADWGSRARLPRTQRGGVRKSP